jgi:hypothetical protein
MSGPVPLSIEQRKLRGFINSSPSSSPSSLSAEESSSSLSDSEPLMVSSFLESADLRRLRSVRLGEGSKGAAWEGVVAGGATCAARPCGRGSGSDAGWMAGGESARKCKSRSVMAARVCAAASSARPPASSVFPAGGFGASLFVSARRSISGSNLSWAETERACGVGSLGVFGVPDVRLGGSLFGVRLGRCL